MAPVGRDQPVIGLISNVPYFFHLGIARIRGIHDPDLARLEQAEHEAVSRRVGNADDLRAGGHFGKHLERGAVEDADAARLVIRRDDQLAVLRDGAADGVARLHDALLDARAQQVHLGHAAVAAENVGIALVARVHERGVRQVAQPGDLAERRAPGGLDEHHAARCPLDHEPQIARAAQRGCRTAKTEQCKTENQDAFHFANPFFSCSTIQRASSSEMCPRQAGIAVPRRPCTIT